MPSIYEKWDKQHIEDFQTYGLMQLYEKDGCPLTGGFDTETTGLHIIKDKPFLIQFGWLIKGEDFGRVFTFYPTETNVSIFFQIAKRFKYFLAHNAKYDMHMLTNIGYGNEIQAMTNICDTMGVARLAMEAIPEREGGSRYSLRLKDLGVNYVDPAANKSASLISDELNRLNAERISILTAALRQFPMENAYTATGKQRFWGKGVIEKFLKDPTHEIEDLPGNVKDVWLDWLDEYPEPTYEDVNRKLMIQYGSEDVITMLEFFRKTYPILLARQQLPILEMEMACILPLYRMERVGIKADLDYLENSRKTVKQEIKRLRFELHGIAGEIVTVGQHERLKQIFESKWSLTLESCDKPNLKRLMKDEHPAPKEAKRFASLINQLRTLEKWYSTYIKRVQKNAAYNGNVYSQINSYGAVSGRMSCDFQQFPKKALKSEKGLEIFNPRKAFTVKGGSYNEIVYIDYDQIELVTQAHYTILVSGGDPNLCRAYMPFRCTHYLTGETFDFKTPEGRAKWNEKRTVGPSVWIDEDGKPWTKTDVHSQTTHKAFPSIELGTELFQEWRAKGKMFNFMANYGGGKFAAMDSLDLAEAEADALVRGYAEAFPHVLIYQKTIQEAHRKFSYIANQYGRRYYLANTRISYKLANYNIQGTCADALKKAIINMDTYLLDNNYKTKMVMPVHDEMQFDKYIGEDHVIPELRRIMEEAFSWSLVPVTAGVESTSSDWSSKKAYVA